MRSPSRIEDPSGVDGAPNGLRRPTSDASHASFGLRVRDPAFRGRSRPTNRNSVTLGNYITLVYREAEGRTDEKKPGTRLRLVLYRVWCLVPRPL